MMCSIFFVSLFSPNFYSKPNLPDKSNDDHCQLLEYYFSYRVDRESIQYITDVNGLSEFPSKILETNFSKKIIVRETKVAFSRVVVPPMFAVENISMLGM
jgi:hypothetical protein